MKNYIKTLIKRIRKPRKRHFQLLELMVAAFILLICVAPTMRILTSMYLSQQEIIRENQRDHLAHLVHAKITELLYKRQIHIPVGDTNPPVPLSDPELNNELKKYSYACEATLIITDKHKPRGQEHHVKYLVQLVIKLKDVSPKAQKMEKKYENQDPADTFYDYTIYIDSGKMASRDDNWKKGQDDKNTEEEGKKKNPNGKPDPNPSDAAKKTSSTQPQSPSMDTDDEEDD